MKQPSTLFEIINLSNKQSLYSNLLTQLQKDFDRASIPVSISGTAQPEKLVFILYTTIEELIKNDFSKLLQLLYFIDVSEEQIKQVLGSENYIEQITFKIVSREWQKVWFRHVLKINPNKR